jgi:signal transduction histidine kinase
MARRKGEFSGVEQNVALAVFRIVQEALRNVAKHARVDAAEVELAHSGSEVRLTVTDHGVGLSRNEAGKTGLGLVSMRERTRRVNGSVEIESTPGEGTRLTVRIPDDAGINAATA